ncbi:MAG: hypothetical protein A2X37_09875 [Elusimicrobia bacterium GWA2_66_18]|nr:MAG: hypothetical protein A2X37_09875 [Elusimicrobia bacterium GWA2_66_18]
MKPAIAFVVSVSLLLSSAGWPASQAFAQSVRSVPVGEVGARARPVAAVASILYGGVAEIGLGVPVLAPSLSAAPDLPALMAAAPPQDVDSARAVSAAAPVHGAPPDAKLALSKPTGHATEDAGPRWVMTPSRGGIAAWVARRISLWRRVGETDSRVAFDGEGARAVRTDGLQASATANSARSPGGLMKPGERVDRIIDDSSIPTPQAAREVGSLRRVQALPPWVKVVAPLSLAAAAGAAVAVGAVPVLVLAAGLVVCVLAHEVAHIAVLRRLGDRTAEEAGTHSLNPFRHVDPLKTIILPALSLAISSAFLPFPVLIGAGKAVDADFNNLRGPFGGPRSARNALYVAGAGPLTNLLLAGIAFAAFVLFPAAGLAAGVALGLAKMNLVLTVFNLIPLPQLDGGKMLAGILPERFYAKWVYNPKVEKAYQGMFRRLYEGPTALLTFMSDKLGIRGQKTLNRAANAVTFGALAAFYAVAYFHFSVAAPLLFLALPCTYDYWCIREKVRSEAAVNDVMRLYSEWAAVIAQTAEDRGMQSEVGFFEAEHAMKNALETLVDEMMAKEPFRALSNEDKLAAVLKAYPDKAAEFLKAKVFTEAGDTLEKIKELLADPRNEACLNRLRKWFEDHSIFERWDNPKYEGKLKGAINQAGKEKVKSGAQGGFARLGVMLALAIAGGAAVFFPQFAHQVPAWLSGLGVLGLMGALATTGAVPASAHRALLYQDDSLDALVVAVEFAGQMTLDEFRVKMALLIRDDGLPSYLAGQVAHDPYGMLRTNLDGRVTEARLTLDNLDDAALTARIFRGVGATRRVRISRNLFDLPSFARGEAPAAGRPTPAAADVPASAGRGVEPDDSLGAFVVAVEFIDRMTSSEFGELMADSGEKHSEFVKTWMLPNKFERLLTDLRTREDRLPTHELQVTHTPHGLGFISEIKLTLGNLVDAAHAARIFQGVTAARHVRVSRNLFNLLSSRGAAPATAIPAGRDEPQTETADASRWQGKVLGENIRDRQVLVDFKGGATRKDVGRILKAYDEVEQRDGGALITAGSPADAAEIARALAGEQEVESVRVSFIVRDRIVAVALPAKIASHGKEHYGVSTLLVKFAGETTPEEITALLGRLGDNRLFRQDDYYVLHAKNLRDVADAAKALAADAAVIAVEVHPNAAAFLEDRLIQPYLEAVSYNHAQSLLVQFKSGTTEETIKEYAKLRRLNLVYPKFRGSELLALLEVPNGADAAVTRQMLVDETLDEGSSVAEVKPFKEQPGEAPVAASQAARDKAAARAVSAEAQTEASKNPARRDPAAEWLSYLAGRKMQDGTTLNDAQIKALATYLRPLAKNPGEPRPPVVARAEEVKRLLPIVTSPRGMRNSVILVGEAGVGKTAVAEGLAEMIEDAERAATADSETLLQFQRLRGRWLVELDINKILTADDPVGVLSAVLDLLPRFNDPSPARGNEVIVLMDEIQKFFLDASGRKIANALKGPLRDGRIAVIATTTRKDYKEFIEKDDAFRRRFEKIDVEEPSVEKTITILRALKGHLRKLHDAFIPDESLAAAAKLADQFDKTNFNPDKAIKAVQDGAELARPDNLRAAITLDVREIWSRLVVAVNEARQALMDKAVASTLALPIESYNRIAGLIQKAEALYAERESVKDGEGRITIDVVKRVIAQKTGIASGQLDMGADDASRYNDMEKTVGERVVNQEPALTAIANAIRRNKAGLSNPHRPMGKFLLTGPTGVGKTYLAKELARFLFKDPEAMIRMDMSEYMEEHNAQRLTGAPPGYVGYGEGGQLTEAVRKKPYSVILFDEIEKAHPKVFDVLLQILDDGRLTDGEGRTIDFKNTVILMTSNAGMGTVDGEKYATMIEAVEKHNDSIELRAKNIAQIEAAWDKELDEAVSVSLKARFRPEFLNRLDEDPRSKNKWIRVNRLRRQDIAKIASLQMAEFKDLLIDRHGTELEIDPSVIDFLAVEGFSPLYGARPMTAAIEKHIIDPMAKWILDEAAQGRKNVRGGLINIRAEGGRIVFVAEAKPMRTTDRSVVEGSARRVAAEVFTLIERLAGDGEAEEPSEGLFDKMMRGARPAPPASDGKKAETAPDRAFFAPGSALSLPPPARSVAALHNKPKAADAALRAEIQAVTDSVERAGWSAPVVSAVAVRPGEVGEGWLKQFVAFAKDKAEKAALAKPLELTSSVSADAVRLAVSFDAELTQADREYLAAHFTGAPPAGYEAAQRLVDDLNLHSSIVRNHYLLDLYGRLRGIPGARMGYASASGRTQIWLEILKDAPRLVDAPAKEKAAAVFDGPAAPHQVGETAKLRGLLLRFIDQSRLSKHDQDGISIRIAAAEAYARIAGPEEAALMRTWIKERGWSGDAPAVKLGSESPMAMTAALVLQRLGETADIEPLEAVLRQSGNLEGDAFTPLKTAFIAALAEIYQRAGLQATREASSRAASLDNGGAIIAAARRALGALGYPSDLEDIREDGDGLAQFYRRMGSQGELVAEFSDDLAWNQSGTTRKIAIFKLLGETSAPTQGVWDLLRQVLNGKRGTGDRSGRYAAAAAWAELVARERLSGGLSAGINRYLDERDVSKDDDTWAVMLAYVLALEKAGRAEDMAALERLMSVSPEHDAIHFRHEQAYFAAPEAWAKIVVRSGKFAEYARANLGPDGAPQPSILWRMLTSKDKPLLAAAALRAMAIARDPSFKEKAVEPQGDAPGLHPGKRR